MLFVPTDKLTAVFKLALLTVIFSVESTGEADTTTEDTLLNTKALYVNWVETKLGVKVTPDNDKDDKPVTVS
jgi:hypothetical protein